MPLDPKSKADYFWKLEEATANIQKAFAVQEAEVAVSLGINLIWHCDIIDLAIRFHGIKKKLNACCQTGGRLVSPAYGWEKKNWTPLFDLSESVRFSS